MRVGELAHEVHGLRDEAASNTSGASWRAISTASISRSKLAVVIRAGSGSNLSITWAIRPREGLDETE